MSHKEFSHVSPNIIIVLLGLAFLTTFISANHYEKFFEIEGGPKYMYYYTKFSVGHPAIEQSAIIDTGSDTLAFPCDHCVGEDCGTHQDHRFQTSYSKSFQYEMRCPLRILYHDHHVCQFVKSYAEGSSILGFLGTDYLCFRNARKVDKTKLNKLNTNLKKDLKLKAEFGCTTKETGLFKTQYIDGIIGLDNASALIESMERNNMKKHPVTFSFGLCFHSNGGIMSIDLRQPHSDEKIVMLDQHISVYTEPIITNYTAYNNYYEIKADKFMVNGTDLKLGEATIMIDSGTTFTHFPTPYLKKIFKELNDYCKKHTDKCGKIKNPEFSEDSCLQLKFPDNDYVTEKELLESFPNIQLHFKESDHNFIIYPKNYFYKESSQDLTMEPNEVRLCMALRGDETDRIILGAFGMIDYYFYFDRAQTKIKIFQVDCNARSTQILRKRNERILAPLIDRIAETPSYVALYITVGSLGLLIALFVRRLRNKRLDSNFSTPFKI